MQGETWAARWHEWQPAEGTLARLYELARGHDASLFTLMYTAIALSLHQLGQAEEILIGTSTSGRTDPAFFDSVGYFTTMVAHRVSFAPTTRFGDLLRQVTRTVNDSLCYADVPLEQIQQGLGMTPADGLLFDVYIQIHASNALNGRLPTPAGEGCATARSMRTRPKPCSACSSRSWRMCWTMSGGCGWSSPTGTVATARPRYRLSVPCLTGCSNSWCGRGLPARSRPWPHRCDGVSPRKGAHCLAQSVGRP
ncbi:condensation domain-containing protein [Aeromonas dhakensis]